LRCNIRWDERCGGFLSCLSRCTPEFLFMRMGPVSKEHCRWAASKASSRVAPLVRAETTRSRRPTRTSSHPPTRTWADSRVAETSPRRPARVATIRVRAATTIGVAAITCSRRPTIRANRVAMRPPTRLRNETTIRAAPRANRRRCFATLQSRFGGTFFANSVARRVTRTGALLGPSG